MHDSRFNPVSGGFARSTAVTYRLVTVDGGPALQMTADAGWVHDPARVFPVTVDPTYTATSNGTTMVLSDLPGDLSGWWDMDIGTWNNGGEIGNAFVAFNGLGSALSGMRITGASLRVFDYWASTCSPARFDVAPVTQAWSVGGGQDVSGSVAWWFDR
jgi:hypothetical protein